MWLLCNALRHVIQSKLLRCQKPVAKRVHCGIIVTKCERRTIKGRGLSAKKCGTGLQEMIDRLDKHFKKCQPNETIQQEQKRASRSTTEQVTPSKIQILDK